VVVMMVMMVVVMVVMMMVLVVVMMMMLLQQLMTMMLTTTTTTTIHPPTTTSASPGGVSYHNPNTGNIPALTHAIAHRCHGAPNARALASMPPPPPPPQRMMEAWDALMCWGREGGGEIRNAEWNGAKCAGMMPESAA